jgi:uncharacterized membrane protein HdeD (DUF308 family)
MIILGSWRGVALRGIAAVVFGLVALIWPSLTLWALVVLFGAWALVDGIFAFVAFFSRDRPEGRVWLLLEGIAGVLAGVVTFAWPDITALALLYVIAAWAFVEGIFRIAAAIAWRKLIDHAWLLGLGGVLSIAFAALLVITPGAGALVITWLIGWAALVLGVWLLMLAARLHSVEAHLRDGVRPARPAAA